MPNNAFKVDKYNITSGRMRVMVESSNGNVRAWIQAHRPAWFESAWDMYIPNQLNDNESRTTNDHTWPQGKGFDGVYQQLGPIHYGAECPGNEGWLAKEVGNARTYRDERSAES